MQFVNQISVEIIHSFQHQFQGDDNNERRAATGPTPIVTLTHPPAMQTTLATRSNDMTSLSEHLSALPSAASIPAIGTLASLHQGQEMPIANPPHHSLSLLGYLDEIELIIRIDTSWAPYLSLIRVCYWRVTQTAECQTTRAKSLPLIRKLSPWASRNSTCFKVAVMRQRFLPPTHSKPNRPKMRDGP
jgi:hypothetical protein